MNKDTKEQARDQQQTLKEAIEINRNDLSNITDQLIKMIAKTGNEDLQDLFLIWQQKRNECNETQIKYMDSLLTDFKQTDKSQEPYGYYFKGCLLYTSPSPRD